MFREAQSPLHGALGMEGSGKDDTAPAQSMMLSRRMVANLLLSIPPSAGDGRGTRYPWLAFPRLSQLQHRSRLVYQPVCGD